MMTRTFGGKGGALRKALKPVTGLPSLSSQVYHGMWMKARFSYLLF
jgi:hypothetical protein